jgi:hypothetical protein
VRDSHDTINGVKRRLVRLLICVWLTLYVAAVGLWIFSYARPTVLTRRTSTHVMIVWIARGQIAAERFASPITEWEAVGWFCSTVDANPPANWSSLGPRDPGSRLNLHLGRFLCSASVGGRVPIASGGGLGNGSFVPGYFDFPPSVRIAFPIWFGVLVLSSPGIAAVVRRAQRARRVARRCCRVCGYDLRATPERCPECGTATALMVAR